MPTKYFIAGTDTGIGKTTVAIQLLVDLNARGLRTIGVKPVASGCSIVNNEYVNDDAMALLQHASVKLPYPMVNPFAFLPPIAPHLAAAEVKCKLSAERLSKQLKVTFNQPCDAFVIEGAGGWAVPLNADETMADFVRAEDFDVILVVGMRLGCLNHAILTARAMHEDGVNVIGWVANCLDPTMQKLEENIETLQKCLPFPLLSVYGFAPSESAI